MEPGIGAVVGGKYRIEQQLGVGAIGAVYRVRHVALKKQLALKVLLPEAARDPEAVRRFEREALVGAHVHHPNVAAAIDFGQLEDGAYYLVLELVRGVTLREVLRQGPLPLRRALRVARGIAAGLAHLHEKGIVHRDLKPANVMLVDGTTSDVKLIDFGLARVQADGTLGRELSTSSGQWQAITDHGNFFGTVAYLAPEVRHGMGAVDERSDLYALGIILCELFAGRRPFVADSMVEVLRLQLQGKPPSLADLTPEPMPPALVALVDSLLHKDVTVRCGSAQRVASELQAIAAEVAAASSTRASTLPPATALSGEFALPGPDVDPDDDLAPLLSADTTGGYRALLGDEPTPSRARPVTGRSASERPPSARPAPSPLVPPVAVTSAPPAPGAAPASSVGPVPAVTHRQRARTVLVGGALLVAGLLAGWKLARQPEDAGHAAGMAAGAGAGAATAAAMGSAAAAAAASASAAAAASASASAMGSATASASATAAGPDLSRAVAAVREATEAKGGMRALGAVLALGEADRAAFGRPEVAPLLVELAAGLEQRGSDREVRELFDYLAPRPSGDGADALFAIVRRSTDSRVSIRAREALARSVQLGVITPALRATLDLVEAPCPQKLTLLPRLVREGDDRTRTELQALQTTECQKARGCCLLQSKAVTEAIEQLATRGR